MSGIVDIYSTIRCFCIIRGFRSGFAFDLNFECRILFDWIKVWIVDLCFRGFRLNFSGFPIWISGLWLCNWIGFSD